MKDYSELIRKEAGFITKINPIVESGEIEVYTSKSKKGKPHKYKLNKENINKLYKRLENQYRILIENKDIIFNNMNKDLIEVLKMVRFGGIGFLCLALIFIFVEIASNTISLFIPQILCLLIGSGMISTSFEVIKHKEKKFNEMINIYKYYLEHRSEIETLEKTDTNITSTIDEKTQTELEESQKLMDCGMTSELFSIQLMDKVSLKQLKELIERYEISKSLEEKQYLYIEEQENLDEEFIEEDKGFSRKKKK